MSFVTTSFVFYSRAVRRGATACQIKVPPPPNFLLYTKPYYNIPPEQVIVQNQSVVYIYGYVYMNGYIWYIYVVFLVLYHVRYARALFFHEKSLVASINYVLNKPHHVKNIIIITIVHGKGLTVTFSQHVYLYIMYICVYSMYMYVFKYATDVLSGHQRPPSDKILYSSLACHFFSYSERKPIIQFLFLLLMILIMIIIIIYYCCIPTYLHNMLYR